jgi:hypothetical protein
MMKFAKAVSVILSPIFTLFPIPFILVARFSQDYSNALKWAIFSYVFILVVIVFIAAGVMLGVFSNFDVSKREQRPLLFSFTAFVIFCYLISLIILHAPRVLFLVVFALIFGLLIFIIVNKWIKASVHVATTAAVVLLTAMLYKGYFFLLLGLIPLLAWSRIKTGKHSLSETIIGCALGIMITLIVYFTTKQFFLGMLYN